MRTCCQRRSDCAGADEGQKFGSIHRTLTCCLEFGFKQRIVQSRNREAAPFYGVHLKSAKGVRAYHPCISPDRQSPHPKCASVPSITMKETSSVDCCSGSGAGDFWPLIFSGWVTVLPPSREIAAQT